MRRIWTQYRSAAVTAAVILSIGAGASAQPAPAGQGQPEAPAAEAPAAEPTKTPKELCSESYVRAQQLQRENKLKASAVEFLACQQPQCGELIVGECVRLYEQLMAQTPSIVIAAYGRGKAEIHGAKVYVDDALVQEKLEGAAITLDPGVHRLRIEAAGYPKKELTITARTGDRNRLLEIPLLDEPAPAPAPAATLASAGEAPRAPFRIPATGIVLGGVGIAGLGAGIVLQVLGASDYDSLESGCGERGLCKDSEVDKVRQEFTFSTIALAVGGAAAIGAVVVTGAANTDARRRARGAEVALVGAPGGAAIRLRF